jgi:8-oxo-dGTP pyrophosphatase MutT (NUDIX family)
LSIDINLSYTQSNQMAKLISSDTFTNKDGSCIFNIYEPPFTPIPDNMIDQVYGIILNDKNQILLCNHINGMVLLPGGKRENYDTSLIATLIREAIEEANVILDEDTIKEAFYQSVVVDDKITSYQIRYIARPKVINKFIKDPDESIISIFWVDIDDLPKHLGWGTTDKVIQDIAKEFIKKN